MSRSKNPNYLNFEEDLNTYIKEDEIKDTRVFRDIVKEEAIKERKLVSKVATPRNEEEEIEPLERETPKIVGSLFDRVLFLRERIEEISKMIELRKTIHSEMTEEIAKDVREKEEIEKRMVDMTDKRNFKMDISSLRKEGRTETVRFWKDILELRTELQELLEQYKTETKIVDIFKNLEMDGLNQSNQAVIQKFEVKI